MKSFYSLLVLLSVLAVLPAHANAQQSDSSSLIKSIQVFGDSSGLVVTDRSLLRTDDNGSSWIKLDPPLSHDEILAAAGFNTHSQGWAFAARPLESGLVVLETLDGGRSWARNQIELPADLAAEIDLTSFVAAAGGSNAIIAKFTMTASSNFERTVYCHSAPDDRFRLVCTEPEMRPRDMDLPAQQTQLKRGEHFEWILEHSGSCAPMKSGCEQTSRLLRRGEAADDLIDITPPQLETGYVSALTAPPGGSTRISLNRGFDKCTAATTAQMQTWWNNSPFYDVNIYIGGSNRGCTQAQLNAAWVNTVSGQGWGLIPTWVGPQAPCTTCTTCGRHSADVPTAETEGRSQADLAITAMNNLGLTQGSIIYYDMERYADNGCGTAVNSFLKGWTDRLKEQGYRSGTYGSPFNANIDWINIPAASRMEAVWLARWNNIQSVWGTAVAPLSDNFFTDHQRIHQWIGPRDETWGGVTFNIDNNISDAPVAGTAILKNRRADFDGDGKTDVSLFRPETGIWYVLNSTTSQPSGATFGASTDLPAPGDYDGDGKTDTTVFRPSDGTWHTMGKAASTYFGRLWGANGDIPVPADYNGDGRTDQAVFRPSNGVWYIANSDSKGSTSVFQWGLNGDKPVPGDYDGDGKADVAVFRPSDGIWYILKSTDGGIVGAAFGLGTDLPTQADYDGDMKTDIAVYRPSTGIWYVLLSSTGAPFGIQWGADGDIPVPGDYDGDGTYDIAVFRPSNSIWYINRSEPGFTTAYFGLPTDRTVPNAYLPQ